MRRMNEFKGAVVVVALAVMTACTARGPRHHLAEYDFSQGSLAVVYYDPPAPELRTGGLGLDARNPITALLSAGGRLARESEGRKATARLDSAAQRVDFGPRLKERTLERTSRYLGTQPVDTESEAGFVLEVDLEGIGLGAESERVGLFVSGDAVLLEAANGREIWRTAIYGTDAVSDNVVSDAVLENFLGAGTLNQLTVEDFEALLGELEEFAADRIAESLRVDLRETREGS